MKRLCLIAFLFSVSLGFVWAEDDKTLEQLEESATESGERKTGGGVALSYRVI
jgi:hypothetical protein